MNNKKNELLQAVLELVNRTGGINDAPIPVKNAIRKCIIDQLNEHGLYRLILNDEIPTREYLEDQIKYGPYSPEAFKNLLYRTNCVDTVADILKIGMIIQGSLMETYLYDNNHVIDGAATINFRNPVNEKSRAIVEVLYDPDLTKYNIFVTSNRELCPTDGESNTLILLTLVYFTLSHSGMISVWDDINHIQVRYGSKTEPLEHHCRLINGYALSWYANATDAECFIQIETMCIRKKEGDYNGRQNK